MFPDPYWVELNGAEHSDSDGTKSTAVKVFAHLRNHQVKAESAMVRSYLRGSPGRRWDVQLVRPQPSDASHSDPAQLNCRGHHSRGPQPWRCAVCNLHSRAQWPGPG